MGDVKPTSDVRKAGYVGKFLQILVRVFRVSPFERRHDNGRGH